MSISTCAACATTSHIYGCADVLASGTYSACGFAGVCKQETPCLTEKCNAPVSVSVSVWSHLDLKLNSNSNLVSFRSFRNSYITYINRCVICVLGFGSYFFVIIFSTWIKLWIKNETKSVIFVFIIWKYKFNVQGRMYTLMEEWYFFILFNKITNWI